MKPDFMNLADTVLLENIDKPASLFIFPTNVAASRWADHALRLRMRLDGAAPVGVRGGTIPMDKFIAWDIFKQNSIRSKIKNRRSVPSVLRKMFVSALIRENAEICARGGAPIFISLIRAEWARQADTFTGWLTGILPQLGAWFKQSTGLPIARIGEETEQTDGELSGDDRDLFTLANRYAQFLNERGLFEPAWETPPFEDTGRECFVFFPESLSDFSEYRELLAASSHVKTVSVSEAGGEPLDDPLIDVFFYANSRSEITEAVLYILALRKNQNVPWDSISVSIPDDEYYEPYLLREFSNRNIPHVRQIGKPLASYPAGQFFAALANCASTGFSFASIKELLLNQHLPWKDPDDINELIEFGIRNNCVSSWTEKEGGTSIPVDVWEDAFAHPLGGITAPVRYFFEDLKRRTNALCRAGSFSEIRKHYFAFRERFFDMENCLNETSLILSRCICELTYLVEIEKSFPDVRVSNPYSFFSGYLREVNYLAQQSGSGVAILPYRTAAPAPFDCHIILGAGQNSLQAVFSPLAFLPKSRREKLGISDNDASLAFIKLHRYNSRLPAAFFCSEQTFTGYAIPHNALNAPVYPRQRYGGGDSQLGKQFAADLYREESNFYASLHWPARTQTEKAAPGALHQKQKRGFEEWRTRKECAGNNVETPSRCSQAEGNPLPLKIRERLCYNNEHKDKISVSASSLAPYFQCPLIWLFSRVLNLENVAIETGLMASSVTGDVYHAVLNLFLDELKKTGEPIAAPLYSGPEHKPIPLLPQAYSMLLAEKTGAVFDSFPRLPHSEYQAMSMLTARLLRAEKPLFFSRLENLLAEFISCFAGFRVIASEESYTSLKDGYFLNGRIDCILEDIRGASAVERQNPLVIVDFKTKYKFALLDYLGKESLADFQLPMYVRLAEEAFGKEAHTALFFSIIDTQPLVLFGAIQDKKDCIKRGSDSYNNIMNEFDQKAERFAAEISKGAFSPSRPEKCRECDYNKICRTLYKVCQGKNNGI
ncbi:MAG: PD-(D/E)XK nuclease family protein [Treponema sp.]|nr:PD-(D/E)XK nuclease family protein [Treponema sp.]